MSCFSFLFLSHKSIVSVHNVSVYLGSPAPQILLSILLQAYVGSLSPNFLSLRLDSATHSAHGKRSKPGETQLFCGSGWVGERNEPSLLHTRKSHCRSWSCPPSLSFPLPMNWPHRVPSRGWILVCYWCADRKARRVGAVTETETSGEVFLGTQIRAPGWTSQVFCLLACAVSSLLESKPSVAGRAAWS